MTELPLLLLYLLFANVLAFIAMGVDKYKAIHGLWRIPEKNLYLVSVLGGALGGILGMRVFRHKTRHPSFKYGLPVMLAVQLAILGWLGIQL